MGKSGRQVWRSGVKEQVRALVERAINPAALRRHVTDDSTFADLHLDAMDLLCITNEIEQVFEFDVNDDEAEDLHSVADLVAMVERSVGK